MEQEQSLTVPGDFDLAIPEEDEIKGLVGSSWLGYVVLVAAQSALAMEDNFPAGTFVLTKDQHKLDLTDSFECLNLGVRPVARHHGDTVLSYYDKDDPNFQFIRSRQDAGGEENRGFLYGVEYLIYLPAQKSYVTLGCLNPTNRNAANKASGLIGKGMLVASQVIKKKYTWYGILFEECNLTELPEAEESNAQVATFRNPTSSTVDLVGGTVPESDQDR